MSSVRPTFTLQPAVTVAIFCFLPLLTVCRMAQDGDVVPFGGPFVVIRNHMGYKRWSRNFETLDEAGRCFDRVARTMGKPDHVDGRYSYFYVYGAHGERLQLVHSAEQFRTEMQHANVMEQIYAMRKYDVTAHATGEVLQHGAPELDNDRYWRGAGEDCDTVEEDEEEDKS